MPPRWIVTTSDFTTIAATGGWWGWTPHWSSQGCWSFPTGSYMLPPCSRRKQNILIRIIKLIPNKWINPSPQKISLSCHQTCFLTIVGFVTSTKHPQGPRPQRRTPSLLPLSRGTRVLTPMRRLWTKAPGPGNFWYGPNGTTQAVGPQLKQDSRF